MTITTRKQPEEKQVTILARNQFLHVDKVEYTVLSSDNKHKYLTTLLNGRFYDCTCPAIWGTCYHGKQLVQIDLDRREAEAERDRLLAELIEYQADQEAAKMTAQDDISTTGKNDPWFGLSSAQRFQAWREYEAAMAGLAS